MTEKKHELYSIISDKGNIEPGYQKKSWENSELAMVNGCFVVKYKQCMCVCVVDVCVCVCVCVCMFVTY